MGFGCGCFSQYRKENCCSENAVSGVRFPVSGLGFGVWGSVLGVCGFGVVYQICQENKYSENAVPARVVWLPVYVLVRVDDIPPEDCFRKTDDILSSTLNPKRSTLNPR